MPGHTQHNARRTSHAQRGRPTDPKRTNRLRELLNLLTTLNLQLLRHQGLVHQLDVTVQPAQRIGGGRPKLASRETLSQRLVLFIDRRGKVSSMFFQRLSQRWFL